MLRSGLLEWRTAAESGIVSIAPLERCTDKEQTQAEVEVRILGHLFEGAADAALHRRR
jgi:hypothetical protein